MTQNKQTSPTKKSTKIYKTLTKSYFKKLEEDINILETSFITRLQNGEFQEMKDFLLNRLLEIDVIFKKKSSSLKKIVLLESIFREENKILQDEKESLIKDAFETALNMLLIMNVQCFESCEKIKERLIKMIVEKYNSTKEEVISLLEDPEVIIKEGDLLLKRKEKQTLMLKSYTKSNYLKVDKTRETQILLDFSENLRKYEKQIDLKMSIVNKEMVEKNEKHLMDRKVNERFCNNNEFCIDGINKINSDMRYMNENDQSGNEDYNIEDREYEVYDNENNKLGNINDDQYEYEDASEDNENNNISIYDLYKIESIDEFKKERLERINNEILLRQSLITKEETTIYNSEVISNLYYNLKKNGSLDMNELHILSNILAINNSIESLSKVSNEDEKSPDNKDNQVRHNKESINEEVRLLITQNKDEIKRFLKELIDSNSNLYINSNSDFGLFDIK